MPHAMRPLQAETTRLCGSSALAGVHVKNHTPCSNEVETSRQIGNEAHLVPKILGSKRGRQELLESR